MATSSTSFKKKWRAGKTTVIRVPEKMAGKLMDIARRWDESGDLRGREEDGVWLIETPRKPVRYSTTKPVNVAAFPLRSPFATRAARRGWCGSCAAGCSPRRRRPRVLSSLLPAGP